MEKFQPEYGQTPLIEKREVLERQTIPTLLGYKALLLSRLSDIETDVHMINNVLEGMGYEEEQ